MKQFGLACLFMLSANLLWATVHRVNNVNGVDAPFRTAQAAHDGAAVGDTLYFEHSSAHYGDLLMSKRLTLLGTGFFLNYTPGKQYNGDAASLNILIIRPTASGSNISVNAFRILDSANSVTISRVYIANTLRLVGASNCVIRHSFIVSGAFFEAIQVFPNAENNNTCSFIPALNNVFHNNILISGLNMELRSGNSWCTVVGQLPTWSQPVTLIAFNNYIGSISNVSGNFYNNITSAIATDATTPVNNNILFQSASSSTRRTFLNNATTTLDTLLAGNANLFSISSDNIVVCQNFDRDTCYQLKPNSPALGAGTNGTNIGPSGGINPYRYAMLPPIPAITSFSTANSSPTGNSINIKVSTTSNN